MTDEPKKPTKIILDCDGLLFTAASAGQQVYYTYSTPKGVPVAQFDSAKAGKNWLESVEFFGCDAEQGYEGDHSLLVRTVEYEIGSLKTATDTFDRLLKEILKEIPHKQWRGKVASKQGARNHRMDKCSIVEYKGNRKNAGKPHYLEDVRRHALTYKQITKTIGIYESDDNVLSLAEKHGSDCMAIMWEKDVMVAKGTWLYAPNLMKEPYYSQPDVIGELWIDHRGKIAGCGFLFCISQSVTGDTADHYKGLEGMGEKGAYELLKQFSGKGWGVLEDAIHTVLEAFRKRYGESYKYKHCMTGEDMDVTFRDVFIENLTLAYMIKDKDDAPHESIRIARKYK